MPEAPPINQHSPLFRPVIRKVRTLTGEVVAQLLALATSALGLVAALAWNDAVQAVFKEYFPKAGGVWGRFLYAIFLSLVIIVITINLTRLAKYAKDGGQKS